MIDKRSDKVYPRRLTCTTTYTHTYPKKKNTTPKHRHGTPKRKTSPWHRHGIKSPSNHCLVTQIAITLIRSAPQTNVTEGASGDTLQGTPVNHRHQLQGADKDVAVIRVPEEKWNPQASPWDGKKENATARHRHGIHNPSQPCPITQTVNALIRFTPTIKSK